MVLKILSAFLRIIQIYIFVFFAEFKFLFFIFVIFYESGNIFFAEFPDTNFL